MGKRTTGEIRIEKREEELRQGPWKEHGDANCLTAMRTSNLPLTRSGILLPSIHFGQPLSMVVMQIQYANAKA